MLKPNIFKSRSTDPKVHVRGRTARQTHNPVRSVQKGEPTKNKTRMWFGELVEL